MLESIPIDDDVDYMHDDYHYYCVVVVVESEQHLLQH